MRSPSCLDVILLTFLLVGVVAGDELFKTALVRRQLTGGGNSSRKQNMQKSLSSSSSKSMSSDKSSSSKSMSSDSPSSSSKSKSMDKSSSSSKSMTTGSSSSSDSKSKSSPSKSKSMDKSSSSSSSKSMTTGSSSSSESKSKSSPSKSKPSSSSSDNTSKSSPSKSKPSSSSSDTDGKGKGKGGKGKGGKGKGGKGKGGKGKGSGGGGTTLKSFAYEDERCGEDINGGCNSDPPIYGSINFDKTLIGQFGAVSFPGTEFYQADNDWFLFDIRKRGCVQATLASIHPGIVTLFEGFTFETDTCLDNLVNVASGDTSGKSAVYCFPEAGQYGVFVAPEFFDPTHCEGQPYTYYLSIDYIECGTCLMESANPGCSDKKCKNKVCKQDESCCDGSWSAGCVEKARELCDCVDGKIVEEDEPCGENINGGCFNDPPAYGSIDFGDIIIGEYGTEWDPSNEIYKQDSDWYLFDIDEPGTCVRATLDSTDSGEVVLFRGSTFDSKTCTDELVNVASGDSSGNAAVFCFEEAGEVGVFVSPLFVDIKKALKEEDSFWERLLQKTDMSVAPSPTTRPPTEAPPTGFPPCEEDPHTYILALEHIGKCGTCLMDNGSAGGCANEKCQSTVCELDKSCCDTAWDATCVEKAKLWCDCAGGKAPKDVIEEEELCGEDINGGCFLDPPAYGSLALGQTLLGEYGTVWNPTLEIYQYDTDWFLFFADKPGTCVQATLTSRETGDVVLFEGSTSKYKKCLNDLVNVASGNSSEAPAVYCFEEAGEYGVFVAPTFQDLTPCEGDPNTYVLTLDGLECGTCFAEHSSSGCSDRKCERQVCNYDESCCDDAWDATCVEKAKLWCNCKDKDSSSTDSSSSSHSKSSDSSSSSDSGKGKGSSPSSNSENRGKGSDSSSRR